jgi:hypothetical protein
VKSFNLKRLHRIFKITMIGESMVAETDGKKEKEKLDDDTHPQNLRSDENRNHIITNENV